MTEPAPSPSAGNRRLVLAWLAVVVPLAWGIGTTVKEAAALHLSNKLWLTLLPLLLGVGVCVCFYYVDRSRFTVRGVVGPYFSSVAILFALFSSLLAAELWQRQDKQAALFLVEKNGLKSMVYISDTLDGDTTRLRNAVRSYLEQMAHSERPAGEALKSVYQLAAEPTAFKNNAVIRAAFLHDLEAVRSARDDRTELHKTHVSPSKFFTLLLFGLLTQIAIGLCHAGISRALAASVMLFSIAFSAAIGILALLDDPYERMVLVGPNLFNGF